MEIDNIKQLIKIAKEEGLTELKYENKDFKVTVNLAANFATTQTMPISVAAAPASKAAPAAVEKPKEDLHEITSPFVGTFYAASAPDKPPFVKVGSKVSKGQTLCILEAMKIMNEIESDVVGEIVEVCVENESLVEYGQCLYKIRKQ